MNKRFRDAIRSSGILAALNTNMAARETVGATYRNIRLRAEQRGWSAVVTGEGVYVSNGIKSAVITSMQTLESFMGTRDADGDSDPCLAGYEQAGMKDKDGKQVPNCIPTTDDWSAAARQAAEKTREANAKGKGKDKPKDKIDVKKSIKHVSETAEKTSGIIHKLHEKFGDAQPTVATVDLSSYTATVRLR